MILGLCERFGCLPSQLLAEDVSLYRYLAIEALGRADVAPAKPEPKPAFTQIPMMTL